VSVQIDQRLNVLAVPNDAVKNAREAVATASLLGLNPDSVQAQLRVQYQHRGSARASAGAQPGGPLVSTSPGDVALEAQQNASAQNANRRQLQLGNTEHGDRGQRVHAALVFTAKGKSFEPRVVMLGAGNFDYTEVVSGAQEGEQVALLSALSLQAQRQQQNDRFRQGMGGVPGMSQNQNAGGAQQRGGGRP
jgi:HlyD family secretion protein